MRTKKIPLRVVKTIPKKWETKEGIIMPFFPLSKKGIYHMVEQNSNNGRKETFLTFETKGSEIISSFLMYKEIIDELKNGGTLLVDETVLKI